MFALFFVIILPLGVVRANDEETGAKVPPPPTPTQVPAPSASAPAPSPLPSPTATPPVVPIQVRSVAPPAPPAVPTSPIDGLTMIGQGGAAFYSPGYDNGGWDAIIRTHLGHGQGDPKTFPYSPDGFYCVHPDFVFGNILTVQNMDTGKTIRCTVADAVAPWDQGYWRNRFVIEMSYALFTALGLDHGNHVTVWALQ
jgi:hypothetical protein